VKNEQVLVLAPVGRDAQLAQRALESAGLVAEVCETIEQLCAQLGEAGAAILTEEALHPHARGLLAAVLERQPAWSDVPLIVFGNLGTAFEQTGNVTFLDRPVRMRTLLSAVRAALRARRRQYQVRDLVAELEQSVRDRDQFLAMLGHELRNPLAAIQTASELMNRSGGEAWPRERAVIHRQTRNLARLVDDLLDVSRITRGKIALHEERVDLRELVQRTAQGFADPARNSGLEIATVFADGPVLVRGDLLRLEQILANLLSNAVKYTNRGGRIDVRLGAEDGAAVLRVSDTGVGISAEMLPRIFDLFMQAPSAIDRAQGGMGIGLTLVQRLVRLHSGEVEARSPGPGKGSEFIVRFPLLRPEGTAVDGVASLPLTPPGRLRVLLAEDNEDAREILQVALEQSGHAVEHCGDGDAAIATALQRRPDAMLIDLGLPGQDGFAVARAVRKALGRAVRLVALTGYGQPSDRDRALAAGFDAFLVKPASLEAVEEALITST